MAERLRSMSRRAATSDRPEMFVELAVLPYKLALVAIDDDVELLLSHALELWRAQAQQARLIASETLRNRAIDRDSWIEHDGRASASPTVNGPAREYR